MPHNKVLIIDFGGQAAQPLARRVREAGVFSEMLPAWAEMAEIKRRDPAAIILAGEPSAATEGKAAEILALGLPSARHGEVAEGRLAGFLKNAGLTADWNMAAFVEKSIAEMREQVGNAKVICGLSGGVDSTVVAVLLSKAIGQNLHCIFVDHGLLRHGEVAEVRDRIAAHYNLNMVLVDASELFLSRLQGVEDPEQKRKIIGHTFIEVFEAEAAKLGKVDFLAQGTIYPDVVESFSPLGPGAVIKSHHNVGGLPERMNMSLVEPLRELFKDEVRQVGAELGLPHDFIWRHPFPGPGLGIRVIGPVDKERLDILRQADAIMQEELRGSGLYEKVWQAFAVLLPLKTVGVAAGARTYENVIALRAVNSVDAMTANWARLPCDFLDTVSRRIISEVNGVNRVVYDISSKPPSTIEWE